MTSHDPPPSKDKRRRDPQHWPVGRCHTLFSKTLLFKSSHALDGLFVAEHYSSLLSATELA